MFQPKRKQEEFVIHATEITYRLHSDDTDGIKVLKDAFKTRLVEYMREKGVDNYQPKLMFGDLRTYKADIDDKSKKDYKYMKIKCSNAEEYNAFIDIRFLNFTHDKNRDIDPTIIRLLPIMNIFEERYLFDDPFYNVFISGLPGSYTHQDLYEFCKQLEQWLGKIEACKMDIEYSWKGPENNTKYKKEKDTTRFNRKYSPFNLYQSLGKEVFDRFFDEWNNADYDVYKKNNGFCCFTKRIVNLNEQIPESFRNSEAIKGIKFL